jgi:hypothetical protein
LDVDVMTDDSFLHFEFLRRFISGVFPMCLRSMT